MSIGDPSKSIRVGVGLYKSMILQSVSLPKLGRTPWSGGLWDETHNLKIVGSNTSTVNWIDIFSHEFVLKFYGCLKKTEKEQKEARDAPF